MNSRRLAAIALAGVAATGAAAGLVGRFTVPCDAWRGESRPLRGADNLSRRPAAGNGRGAFVNAGTDASSPPIVPEESRDDSGFSLARRFTGPIHDPGSLEELRAAIEIRGRLGRAVLRAELDYLPSVPRTARQQQVESARLFSQIGLLGLYDGRFGEASAAFTTAVRSGHVGGLPARAQAELHVLLGIAELRQAELESGRSPFAIAVASAPAESKTAEPHQARSRLLQAIEQFERALAMVPGDPRTRWLLSLAQTALGDRSEARKPHDLLRLGAFQTRGELDRFDDVTPQAGLAARGPGQAGGVVFDDFTGDDRPDLFIASLDVDRGAALFVNRGDGTFSDRSAAAGLGDQIGVLSNCAADVDNDGDLDVLLLRGGWDRPLRLSLLQNRGGGQFVDVTLTSGLGEPIATGAAAWGDYDNDGWIDVFICGEFDAGKADPRNLCRLYRNQGGATFKNVAATAGVTNGRLCRGAAWGDYDADGNLDLFVSNFDAPCRLYHNDGNGTFRDVAAESGVAGPGHHRSVTCWFWDFDNDGRIDLFVNDHNPSFADVVASYLGENVATAGHPRLYHNQADQRFNDSSVQAGLNRPIAAIAANFADLDNDGYLDTYLASRSITCSARVPGVMLKNIAGRALAGASTFSRTGWLCAGSSAAFADWDGDGDLDMYVVTGGFAPGDRSESVLLRNRTDGRHWLKVKLVGTRTNRAAVGTRIRVSLREDDHAVRSLNRTIGTGPSSSGGNCLVASFGLDTASRVAELSVFWPTSKSTQTFRDLEVDQFVEITEGSPAYRVLASHAVVPSF